MGTSAKLYANSPVRLPAGSKVGVVLFDQTARTKLPLTPTPETLDERQRLATSSLPRNPSRIAQSQKCIICGLQEAVRMLEGDIDQRSASGGSSCSSPQAPPSPSCPSTWSSWARW
nr:uncharacterized protein LOC113813227 [Penaeus vannamei]